MIIILKTPGPRVRQLQMRMSKLFSKYTNSSHGFPLDLLHLRLDYEACLRIVSCATASTCFHTRFTPASLLVLDTINACEMFAMFQMLQQSDTVEIYVGNICFSDETNFPP